MGDGFNEWMDSHEIEQYVYQLVMRNKWKSALRVIDKGLSIFPLNEDLLSLKLQLLIKTQKIREIHDTLAQYELLKGKTLLTIAVRTILIALKDPKKALRKLLYELSDSNVSPALVNFFLAFVNYFVEHGYFKPDVAFKLSARVLNVHGEKVKQDTYTFLLLNDMLHFLPRRELKKHLLRNDVLSEKGYWGLWWHAGRYMLSKGKTGSARFFAVARKLAFPYFQKTMSFYLAFSYLRDMRPQHAMRWINKIQISQERFPGLYRLKMYILARSLYMKGNVEDALFPLTELLTSTRKPSLYIQSLYARAMLRAYPDDRDRTRTFLKLLKVLRFPEDMLWCMTARLYLEQGQKEKAINYLKDRTQYCESPLIQSFLWALYGTENLTDKQKKLLKRLQRDDVRWTFLREEFLSLTSKWLRQL